jgi:hypothetical protein
VDWTSASAVVVRSTWDYHLRLNDFLGWTQRVGARTKLYNPPRVIGWSAHKRYLTALASRGVPTTDTVIISEGESVDLAAIVRDRGWTDIVIKPAVSLAAYETRYFRGATGEAVEHLARVLGRGDGLIQPLLPLLVERGELCLIYINGKLSHAVRRRSALATDNPMPASAPGRAGDRPLTAGAGALAAAVEDSGADGPPLYARIDLAESMPDEWVVQEVELVEPSLYFGHALGAAERMAEAIARAL